MMKQLAVLLALLLVMMPLVRAQEDNGTPITPYEFGESINGELMPLLVPKGAIVRLLQLERQLDIKIAHSELIVSELNLSDNTDLTSLINELRIIKDEVSAYTVEGALDGMTIPEMAQVFIDLRDDSRDVINEFRELVHSLTVEAVRERVRQRLEEINETTNSALRERLNIRIKSFNADRVSEMLDNLRINNAELVNQVLSGELGKSQVMNQLKGDFNGLGVQARVQAALNVVEKATQLRARNQASIDSVLNNRTERLQERLENRVEQARERLNNTLNTISERIQSKISNVRGGRQ